MSRLCRYVLNRSAFNLFTVPIVIYCRTSHDKCTYCKLLWIKASTKRPQCKWKCRYNWYKCWRVISLDCEDWKLLILSFSFIVLQREQTGLLFLTGCLFCIIENVFLLYFTEQKRALYDRSELYGLPLCVEAATNCGLLFITVKQHGVPPHNRSAVRPGSHRRELCSV